MVNNINHYIKNPPLKRGIFCFISFLFLLGIQQVSAQAKIKLSDTKKNFGFVKQGEQVSLDYDFTNTGNEPLVITDAKVECSCTSVEFPKQPIAPGQKNKITVKFDTKTVYDRQDRIVEIISNGSATPVNIRYKGVVLRK